MYYEIRVNGNSLGIFGHPNIKNMHLSLQLVDGHSEIYASAVCQEGNDLYMISWLQHPVRAEDVVEFERTSEGPVPTPINKYKMREA